MNTALLEELTDKYITGTATPAEATQLAALLNDAAYLHAFEQQVERSLREERFKDVPDELLFSRIYAGIEARIRPAAPVRRLRPYRFAAAAAVLLAIAASGFWLLRQKTSHTTLPAVQAENILPGSNKAVLTLGNGNQVALDSTAREIAQQGGAVMQRNGQLRYSGSADANTFNTLSTPRGGQFRLHLPDGTEVWLNAASSIRFPLAFSGKERKVELTGEAYFEVAKNAAAPFKVVVNNTTEVLVLGTSFNISAYADEPTIRTTLLSGRVKVNAGNAGVMLAPGQQAVNADGRLTVDQSVDTEKAVAWKNGLFNFQDLSLKEVMRQLSRWYNIDVVYEDGVPEMEFFGKMQRDIPLSGMLKMLERAGVQYRLEGTGKLVILPAD